MNLLQILAHFVWNDPKRIIPKNISGKCQSQQQRH